MRKFYLLLILSFILFPLSSYGVGSSQGKVSVLVANTGNRYIFQIAGGHSGKPPCSSVPDDWGQSLTHESGRAMYAMLLSAYVSGKVVEVIGTGTCGPYSDREEPGMIKLSD